MTPAEFHALRDAWQRKERRNAQNFAALALIVNHSLGGKLEIGDLMDEETEPDA